MCQREWKCVQVHRMVVFQGELPFSIDVKGGENVVGRGVMIAGGVLLLPSMPKGEIVDQQLSLMSTQAAQGANPILHGNLSYQINIFWVNNDFDGFYLSRCFC